MGEAESLVDAHWVAKRLGVTTKTIRNWVSNGKKGFPIGAKLGTGRCDPRRWKISDIEDYIKQQHDQAA